ncbi:a-type inclusion protein [Anaeramoeba flamelloides]|uniref:A-type inclusion protein n=1 Tax=Anaeramoeba flamelloides TaxID=1746091 RepID=A0ABQ8XUR6_9EUKA|nr:a-type inclusion protein [Anaeramoeba flamelloides]
MDLKTVKTKIRSPLSWVRSSINSVNKTNFDKNLKICRELLDNNPGAFSDSEGEKFKNETEETIRKYTEEFELKRIKKETQQIKTKTNSAKSWLGSAIRSKNVKSISKYMDTLRELLTTNKDLFHESEEGLKYYNEMVGYLEEAEKEASSAILENEAKTYIAKARSPLSWASSYTKRDPKKALDYLNQAREVIRPLLESEEKYSTLKVVKDFLIKFHEQADQLEGESGDNQAKQAIENDSKTFKSQISYLNSALRRKRVEDIQMKSEKLKDEFKAFYSKYSEEKGAQTIIKQVQEMLDKIDAELPKIIFEAQMSSVKTKYNSIKSWLGTYLRQTNSGKINEYKDQLLELVEPLRQQQEDNEAMKNFLQEVDDLIENTMRELGEKIEKKEVNGVIQKANSIKSWTSTYLRQRDVGKVQDYQNQLLELVEPLRLKYPENEKAKKFLKEVDELVESVTKEMGQLIEKMEVESVLQKAKSAKTWLSTCLNQQDVEKASEYQRQLLEIAGPLRGKYPKNETAKNFLNEVDELVERVEIQLGDIIKNKVIEECAIKLKSGITWMTTFKNQKNVDKVLEYKEKLQKDSEPLYQYEKDEKAKNLLDEVNTLLQTVEIELGEIIATLAIDRILPKINSATQWINSSYKQKNVPKVQIYQKQLLELVEQLQEYDKYEKAKTALTESLELLSKIENEMGDMIAEREINQMKPRIESAIRFFKVAMEKGATDEIINKREYLLENSAPLKLKFGKHKLAADLIRSIDEAIDKCEKMMGSKIAESTISKARTKFAQFDKLLKTAIVSEDKPTIGVYVQKMLIVVYPLKVQYPELGKELINQVERYHEEYPIKIGNFQQKEIEKLLQPMLKEWSELENKERVSITYLKTLNNRCKKLRKQYLHVPSVSKFLTEVDQLNMKLVGKIPNEEEVCPVFEVHWKLPSAIQTPLKAMNESSKKVNVILEKLKYVLDNIDTTGAEPTTEYIYKELDRLCSPLEQTHMPKLKKNVGLLLKEDPQNAAGLMMQRAIESLMKKYQRMGRLVKEKCQFAIAISDIYKMVMSAGELLKDAIECSKDSEDSVIDLLYSIKGYMKYKGPKLDRLRMVEMWPRVLGGFDHMESRCNTVARLKPDNHPETDLLIDYLNANRILAEQEMKKWTLYYVTKFSKKLYTKDCEEFLQAYATQFPDEKEELESLRDLAKRLEQAEEEERKKEELERQRKAEEERQRKIKLANNLEAEHKCKYSSGRLQTPTSGNWEYSEDGILKCVEGRYVNIKYRFQKNESRGIVDVRLEGATANLGWATFDGHSFYYLCKWGRCWSSTYQGTQGTQGSPFGLNEKSQKLLDQTKVTGNPPPMVVLFCSHFDYSQERLKVVRKQEEERLREEKRQQQAIQSWNNVIHNFGSCQQCHTSGSNVFACRKCMVAWCSKCLGGSSHYQCPFCGTSSNFDVRNSFLVY